MDSCRHLHLVLLPQAANKLRCRHCHLTITAEELNNGYCPECYHTHGRKNSDFEEVETSGDGKTRYRCEECGVIIDVD
jgi:rubrerythrin